jgi:WD40 repeat protein
VTAVHFVGLSEDVVTAAGDKMVRLERATNGQQIRSFAGSSDYVHSVAASEDGSTIVAGGEDGVLFVWDGKSGSLKHRYEPPQATTAAATQPK